MTAQRYRNSDPESSVEAAASVAHLIGPSHRLVERILTDAGRAMTQLDVETAAIFQYGWNKSGNRIRSAVAELEGRRTERAGFTSPARGRRRQLWRLRDE